MIVISLSISNGMAHNSIMKGCDNGFIVHCVFDHVNLKGNAIGL